MSNGNNWQAIIIGLIVGVIVFVGLDILVFPTISIIALIFGVGFAGVGTLIVGSIIVMLIFLIGKAEDRKRAWTLFGGGAKKRLNAVLPFIKLMRDAPEGREPQVLIENKHIIHANVNYTTRAEITYRYWAVVKEAVKTGEKIVPIISKFTDPSLLRKDIIIFRSGDGNKKTSDNQMPIGWNRYNKEVIKLVNDYFRITARTYLTANYRLKPTSKFKTEAVEFENLESRALALAREMEESYEKYKVRTEAYKSHHILRAFKGVILTMSNVTGDVYENPQIFARPGAKIVDGETGRQLRDVAGKEYVGRMEVPTTQVNQYGELAGDINAQKDDFGDLPHPYGTAVKPRYRKPRRLKNMKDIIDYPHFMNLMKNIELDWKGLAWDIRYGFYHKKSRTAQDYIDALKKNRYPEWRDADIAKSYQLSFTNPAVDLRALANPGFNIYWGRNRFNDDEPQNLNQYPAVSSVGLKRFLKIRIQSDVKNKQRAHEYMEKIPADTEATEKVVEKQGGKSVVTKPIGGTLADEGQKAA